MSILIVYWTGTGNTKLMAEKLAEAITDKGLKTSLKLVYEATVEDITSHDRIMFGCPSMGQETLQEEDFEPFFQRIEDLLKGKKVALFGSYGWGEGEWMKEWENRVREHGGLLFSEGLIVNSTPDEKQLEKCYQYGTMFADF